MSDNGRHAVVLAVLLDDWHAATAAGNHHVAGVHEVLHSVELDEAHGLRAGDHHAPATAGILFIGSARLGGALGGLLFGEEGTHGLGGVQERRVVSVHHGLGDQGGRGAADAAGLQLVQDGLGELIADVALRLSLIHI